MEKASPTTLAFGVCEGNMTYRVNGIKEKAPDTWIEISPELAAERKIETGRWVELTSRHGRVRVRALVTERVHGNQLYLPMNSSDIAVNRLTGSHTDRATHTPAYKETAVKMRLLDEVGESPLPRGNSRLGAPTFLCSPASQISRVMHTHLHAYHRRIYIETIRVSIGLQRSWPPHLNLCASYAILVHRCNVLPTASFRLRLATDALALG